MQIQTKRLLIRPFEINDLVLFKKLLTIPELPGWQKQQERSKDFLQWHISNYNKMDLINGICCFGIFNLTNSELFGAIGAGKHDDLGETEIFYQLLPSARRRGIATEAAQAVTHWVFSQYNMNYIIGTVGIDNIASQKVLENCGFLLIEEKTLCVHITGETHRFLYYRKYKKSVGDLCKD